MHSRARAASSSTRAAEFLLDTDASSAGGRAWFVYLFALTDCSAFKVGFSCNPLQRICTFSRRYFERFDLSQSLLLELPTCDMARALEARVKAQLVPYRAEAPTWVPVESGGHTEWFSAVYFGDAEALLRSSAVSSGAASAFASFRAELERVRGSFESWACHQAQRVCEMWSSAQRGYRVELQSAALRDWLDAYRYFNVPLFAERPDIIELVRGSARLTLA